MRNPNAAIQAVKLLAELNGQLEVSMQQANITQINILNEVIQKRMKEINFNENE